MKAVEYAIPVWLTRGEIWALKELAFGAYQEGKECAMMHTLDSKLGLAHKSMRTKKPATSPQRQPRKKKNS